jgi:hypothetical protein
VPGTAAAAAATAAAALEMVRSMLSHCTLHTLLNLDATTAAASAADAGARSTTQIRAAACVHASQRVVAVCTKRSKHMSIVTSPHLHRCLVSLCLLHQPHNARQHSIRPHSPRTHQHQPTAIHAATNHYIPRLLWDRQRLPCDEGLVCAAAAGQQGAICREGCTWQHLKHIPNLQQRGAYADTLHVDSWHYYACTQQGRLLLAAPWAYSQPAAERSTLEVA